MLTPNFSQPSRACRRQPICTAVLTLRQRDLRQTDSGVFRGSQFEKYFTSSIEAGLVRKSTVLAPFPENVAVSRCVVFKLWPIANR